MNSTLDPEVLDRGGVRLDENGLVATIILSRPATKNSQTPATWMALRAIGAALDPAVRVVVVQGEGDTFSSGLDRRMLSPEGLDGEASLLSLLDMPDGEMAESIAGWQEGFTWLRRNDIVSVAAVQGSAVGAGFQLALACDLRVLADDARFSMREPILGLVPDLTGTKPLVELVGYSRALEICATTRWVGAEEALAIGLATAVVPREELTEAVSDLVAALTAPLYGAVTETKALLQSAAMLDLEDQRQARARGAGASVPGARRTDGGVAAPPPTRGRSRPMSMHTGMGPVWRHMRTDRSGRAHPTGSRHRAPGRSASPRRTSASSVSSCRSPWSTRRWSSSYPSW